MHSSRFKSCHSHKELHKILKFQGQFDLEGQSQTHQCSKPAETFRWSIHSSSVKVKFQMGQSKSLHQYFISLKANMTMEAKFKVTGFLNNQTYR